MSTFIKVRSRKYRILGDNTTDETAIVQAAVNDAIASGAGTLILPPIPSMCKITGPIIIQPAPGQIRATLKILAAGGPQNGYPTYFNYAGPSDSSIFVMMDNMLYCQFNGVGVNLGSGQSNVVVWDIQGGGDMGLYLWEHCNIVFDGVTYCIGWRIGQTPTQSNVPDNVWRQCSVSGSDNTSGCIGVQIGGSQAEVQTLDACGFELLSCGVLNGPISTNLSVAANEGDPTIKVFDTFLFPPSGMIQFGDGTQVTYTAKTPTTFTISGGMPNPVALGTSVNQYVTGQGVYTGISNSLTWDGGVSGGNARDFQLAGSAKISNSHFESLTIPVLVPVAPTLTQASGGTLGVRTENYKITFVNPVGETTPSAEVSILANLDYLVTVTSPSNPGVNIIGYNIYAATTAGEEKLQNGSPIPLGTNWTEPTTGLTTTGAAPPTVNTTAANNRFLQIGDWGASAVSGKIEVNGVYIANYTPPADTNYGFGYSLGVIWMTSNFNLRLINCDIINFISQYTNQVSAPAAPTLTQSSGGTLGTRIEYYKITFVNPFGETTPSAEASISANASYLVSVTSPSNPGANCTGYNVYAATTSGAEKLQNSSPIAFGTNWTEPATGLSPSGASPPSVNTATNYFLTIVNAGAFGTVCMENCNISATYPFINNVENWPLYFTHVVLTTTDGLPVSVIDQDYKPPIVLTDATISGGTVTIDLSLGTKFLLTMSSSVSSRNLALVNANIGIPRFQLFFQQPASGSTCTINNWFSGNTVLWQGGPPAPQLTQRNGAIDIFDFDEPVNGTYLGIPRQNYYP